MKYLSTPATLTVYTDDGARSLDVSRSDISYQAVHDYVVDRLGDDFDVALELFQGEKDEIVSVIDGLSSAVGGQHGTAVSTLVLDVAKRVGPASGVLGRLRSHYGALGKLSARVRKNPSQESRAQLLAWLSAEGFTVTPKGFVVGYKAVTADYLSIHAGSEKVTVSRQDGSVVTARGHVPYPIGATVTMSRVLVDTDRQTGCSRGLHVGTWEYASSFAPGNGHVMLVLVDPADVVSVPADSSNQKMRVARLVVAGEAVDGKVPDAVMTVRNPQALADYQADPANYVPSSEEFDCWDEDDSDEE